MREWLTTVENIGASIKKVIGSGNTFITERCVKMSDLDGKALPNWHVSFEISLWESYAVSSS
jgi:hypothetical protein